MIRIFLTILVLTLAGVVQAEVFVCTDADGHRRYQDRACTGDQRSESYDPQAKPLTTLDAETGREQTQGALVLREQIREQQTPKPTPAPAGAPTEVVERYVVPVPVYQSEFLYPPYRNRDRDRHRRPDRVPPSRVQEDPRARYRPDTSRERFADSRRGGGYVPSMPTTREISPRPPSDR